MPYNLYMHKDVNFIANASWVSCKSSFGMMCIRCDDDIAHRRWIIGVLSRTDNKSYLINIDQEVYGLIQTLTINVFWKDTLTYDLNISLTNGTPSISPLNKGKNSYLKCVDKYIRNLIKELESFK